MKRSATRRPRRARAGALLLLGLLAGLLLWFQNCGREFGLDLSGMGLLAPEEPSGKEAGGAERRAHGPCQLRLDAGGLKLGGRRSELTAAVRACKRTGSARLVVTGDAVQGELDALEQALAAAGVPVLRQP